MLKRANAGAKVEGSSWICAAREGLFQAFVILKKGVELHFITSGNLWGVGIE